MRAQLLDAMPPGAVYAIQVGDEVGADDSGNTSSKVQYLRHVQRSTVKPLRMKSALDVVDAALQSVPVCVQGGEASAETAQGGSAWKRHLSTARRKRTAQALREAAKWDLWKERIQQHHARVRDGLPPRKYMAQCPYDVEGSVRQGAGAAAAAASSNVQGNALAEQQGVPPPFHCPPALTAGTVHPQDAAQDAALCAAEALAEVLRDAQRSITSTVTLSGTKPRGVQHVPVCSDPALQRLALQKERFTAALRAARRACSAQCQRAKLAAAEVQDAAVAALLQLQAQRRAAVEAYIEEQGYGDVPPDVLDDSVNSVGIDVHLRLEGAVHEDVTAAVPHHVASAARDVVLRAALQGDDDDGGAFAAEGGAAQDDAVRTGEDEVQQHPADDASVYTAASLAAWSSVRVTLKAMDEDAVARRRRPVTSVAEYTALCAAALRAVQVEHADLWDRCVAACPEEHDAWAEFLDVPEVRASLAHAVLHALREGAHVPAEDVYRGVSSAEVVHVKGKLYALRLTRLRGAEAEGDSDSSQDSDSAFD